MTYAKLLKHLQCMSPQRLKQKARLLEGCSGNWTTITCVGVADDDIYRDSEETGTDRHRELSKITTVKPIVRKNQVYICHDH